MPILSQINPVHAPSPTPLPEDHLLKSWKKVSIQARDTCFRFLASQFLRRGVVSTSSQPQVGGPFFVGCPRLLIQYIRSYPPYWMPFVHRQPEDASVPWWQRPTYRGFSSTYCFNGRLILVCVLVSRHVYVLILHHLNTSGQFRASDVYHQGNSHNILKFIIVE